jgi:hypothetical protein
MKIRMENNSVLDVKSLGLFTDYARIEGEKRGEKKGKREGEKKVYTQIVLNAANEGMSIEDMPVSQICH